MHRRVEAKRLEQSLLRIAALAFGVVAGLVASLILALGGLDAAALTGVDPRQLSLFRFVLFLIANFGVFGAGVVLAAPLVGAVLFIVGAIAWVVAAVLLHHGPDYVMLVPPALLLASAGLAIIAFVRRLPRDYDEYAEAEAIASQRAAIALGSGEDEDDSGGGMPVGASFFGDHGTATPMRGAMARQPEPSYRDRDDEWEPVRRRTEPPRQKPLFRSADEDDDDEESGFWRVSRVTSSILSFGLYGALVAAAVLIFFNLRTGADRPSATKIEASSLTASSARPAQVAQTPVLEVQPKPSSAEVAVVSPALISPSITMPDSSAAPVLPPANPSIAEASEPILPSSVPPAASTFSSEAPEPPASSAEPPPEDLTLGEPPTTGPLLPFPMTAQMAAARSGPATRRPTQSAPPRADTGL